MLDGFIETKKKMPMHACLYASICLKLFLCVYKPQGQQQTTDDRYLHVVNKMLGCHSPIVHLNAFSIHKIKELHYYAYSIDHKKLGPNIFIRNIPAFFEQYIR